MPTRQEVYDALDSERSYQQRRWPGDASKGEANAGRGHEIASWLCYMQSYLNEAINLASHNSPETIALDAVRKVAAMGVACMEEHGAPKR